MPSSDDSQPFDMTFRPYVWAPSTSELRHLIQSCNRVPVSMDSESSMGVYDTIERRPGSHRLIETTQPGRFYQDYGSLNTNLLDSSFYADFKMSTKGSEIDSESNILCTRLQLNASYKCVKCTKVNVQNVTSLVNYFVIFINIKSQKSCTHIFILLIIIFFVVKIVVIVVLSV